MEENKHLGIENLKKAVHVGLSIGMTAANALADGKITLSEGLGFLPGFMEISGVNFASLKAEVADLDATERADLNKYIADTFDIADDVLEAKIEGAIRIFVAILDEVGLFQKK